MLPRRSAAGLTPAQQQRKNLHLRYDADWMRVVAAEASGPHPLWGIPLLAAEREHLASNGRAAGADEAITRILDPLGVYGGSWLDDDEVVRVHVVTTRELSEAEYASVVQAADGVEVVLTVRPVPYRQLLDVVDAVSRTQEWKDGHVNAAGPDPRTGKVVVSVQCSAPASVSAALIEAFGDLITVELTDARAVGL